MTETGQDGAEPAGAERGEPEPTAPAERVVVLDVLRGFALYGVLIANAGPWFSGRAFMPRAEVAAQTEAVDRGILFVLNVFVSGKAMTLLTFLFGLGFSLQLERAEASGRSVVPLHLRRVASLALIGVCHVLLIWWGDILWGYAIAAVGLALFRRVRGWKLLAWGLGLALVPQIIASIPSVSRALGSIIPEHPDREAFRAQVFAAITGDDRRALTEAHVLQAYHHMGRSWAPYFLGLLGRFLLGYWIGTTRLVHNAEERLPFLRKLLAWGLVLGIAGSSVTAVRLTLQRRGVVLSENVLFGLSISADIGVLLLAGAYLAAIILLMRRPAWRRALMAFAPVGQMALTSYLLQSLICTFIFYGWGLGLAGKVRVVHLLPITLAVFIVEALISRAWLSRFRFGPAEWLWRSMTYGRIQPLRREQTQER
jgi:uncharacterized protein